MLRSFGSAKTVEDCKQILNENHQLAYEMATKAGLIACLRNVEFEKCINRVQTNAPDKKPMDIPKYI